MALLKLTERVASTTPMLCVCVCVCVRLSLDTAAMDSDDEDEQQSAVFQPLQTQQQQHPGDEADCGGSRGPGSTDARTAVRHSNSKTQKSKDHLCICAFSRLVTR